MAVRGQDIAIIGTGCRFAGGATSPSKLWDLLSAPRLVASEVPALKGFYHDDRHYHGHANVKEAYLLAGEGVVRRFDAAFFSINPLEAKALDPQIRLLLETVYEALEAAGQTIDGLKGSDTAVYAGQSANDYQLLIYRDLESTATYHATGTSRSMLSNRVSYFFDWHGPSMTIDTACSSSLVALHHAVQQLRLGHSRAAVVAGSNLLYDVGDFIAESNFQMLSPDARSRMWDADANGYARGEGVATLLLKTRQAAEADGDHIECIIRETALNQDGRTPGQTMPSAAAQTQLIRDCYARAGLDLTNPGHHPQYFEAHGTGTPAGDPIEAEAIRSAFITNKKMQEYGLPVLPLFVGSSKTVIGHTEATAGLAGLLKASLALQNSMIPPNILLNRLNPHIDLFHDKLQVPISLIPWPVLKGVSPRRASVNSFGFGGTNAHAILESYIAPVHLLHPAQTSSNLFVPFVFSAASEASLKSYLSTFRHYLCMNESIRDLRSITYTLNARRTRFSVGTAIVASTADELCTKIERKLEASVSNPENRVGVRVVRPTTDAEKPRILGVFTGQGAQWAQMGLDLIIASAASRRVIERLQNRLDRIHNPPKWSLLRELQESGSSRVMEASISQPLCTAIQILQVDLIREAGIQFTAVVGHSSGEIAAAYAAGLISAEDAICIAYYRGLHSDLSKGLNGQKGSMMAVGTSADDIQNLLDFPEFQGRACIAAINSETSITISGDEDVVEELEIVLKDEQKFVRRLKVDKAYHSHHMQACSAKYLDSLTSLNLQLGPGGQATWYSSVSGQEMCNFDLLKGPYWDSNMVKPVLFMQAVDSACASIGSLDLVIELGPHPALRGPTLQTIQNRLLYEVPYTGLFHRSVSAVTSFAESLGYIWSHLGKGAIDLQAYDNYVSGNSQTKLIKGIPTYAWDHHNEYWHESRYAKAIRMRPGPVHELLGHLTPDSTDQDMRWRHILRLSEMSWLKGHRLQNIIVFPATGYIVTALEAALILSKDAPVTLIEILDIDIVSALVFEYDDLSIEIIVSLTNISRMGENTIEAQFKYHGTSGKDNDPLELKAKGHVRIHLGQPCHTVLPVRPLQRPNMVSVSENKFYKLTSDLEYQYSGQFRSLVNLERKLGAATGSISMVESSSHLIHPAALDAAFQSTFLTYVDPDEEYGSMHIPRRIRRLIVNPDICARGRKEQKSMPFDSVHSLALPHANMVCDIDIYLSDCDHAMIQVQGLECVPISQHTSDDDNEVFASVVWSVVEPDIQAIDCGSSTMPNFNELAALRERAANYYLRVLNSKISINHLHSNEDPCKDLYQLASDVTSSVDVKNGSFWQPQWEQDTPEILATACEPFRVTADMKVLSAFEKDVAAIVRGDQPSTNLSTRAQLLAMWYHENFGAAALTTYTVQTMKQVVHRFPHMHILEIRAGMDTVTEAILQQIGHKFASYTVTGAPSCAFDKAQSWLDSHKDNLTFRVSDISTDLREQGFPEGSYDVVLAPLSLHATKDLSQALRNARRMLKAGGYLIVLELIPPLSPFFSILFEWLSAGDKTTSPLGVDSAEWDNLLHSTGFSGIDTSTADQDDLSPFSLFVSQAVDNRVSFLREPLSVGFPTPTSEILIQDLIIVGGNSLRTSALTRKLALTLGLFCNCLKTVRSLSEFQGLVISPNTTILSLVDLDTPVFKNLNNESWEGLKKMVQLSGTLVWITHGRLADNPYANMVLGLLRGAVRDNPALDYLIFDIEDERKINHRIIAEALLRYKAASRWCREGLHLAVENELVLDKVGRMLVPRLIMNEDMNERYNSNRRGIRRRIKPFHQNIGITLSKSGWDIDVELCPPSQGELRVTHSILSPIRVAEFTCMFLILGEDRTTGDKKIALSSQHSTFVCPYTDISVVTSSSGFEPGLLWSTAHHLLASIILRRLLKGDEVLVYEPSAECASALTEQATLLGVCLTFVTTKIEMSRTQDNSWLMVHPATTDQNLERLAGERFSAFVDMTTHMEINSIGSRIAAVLPNRCRKDSIHSLFGRTAWGYGESHREEIRNCLVEAVGWASTALTKANRSKGGHIPISTINSVTEDRNRPPPLTVIVWDTPEVSVQVRPIDCQISLPDNKTYWLVGLTGRLGLSLCEWMVQRGARHFVFSSRSPHIEMNWLDEMRGKGAVIKISACDVTKRDQVVALHSEICSNMPPIAGVAQGAMVLMDTNIQNMTLEQLWTVTKPKVEGSIYLNELFQENTLDFFVFFSSAVAVTGNYGQANYAAANTFMASLAEQRRRRGLAATVIDIGPIFGIGYISWALEGSTMANTILQTAGLARTSERDFHQLFGEALLSGGPGSTNSTEILSGVRTINQDEKHKPIWESWARMSHFVRAHEQVGNATATATESRITFKGSLSKAQSREQVYDIILDAFSRELESHFQIEVGQLSKAELSAMRFDQIGIDSLTAVEIRGWFTKNLEVNIPVLKILNGGSIGELVTTGTMTIPSQLVPSLNGGFTNDSGVSASVTSQEVGERLSTGLEGLAEPEQEASVPIYAPLQHSLRPERPGLVILKSIPVSFTQARFYPAGLFLEDRVGLNHTVWARIIGDIDPERLRQAVRALGEQNEILRTAFFDQQGQQMQHILETSVLHLEQQRIGSEEEVSTIAMSIQKGHVYDVENGEVMRLILLTGPAGQNFLIVGLHPLVIDATSFQILLRQLALHYNYPNQKHRMKQFSEASEERRVNFNAGKLEAELRYWRNEFATPPPPLPLLTLASVNERPILKAYENARADCKISVNTKRQILNVCRRLRATPFHFYLAALRALLLCYTVGEEDITMAVAESGRGHNGDDLNVIGPLYNLVLVRLIVKLSTKFEDLLEATRDKTYAGLENSRYPYPMLVKELHLQRNAKHYPFFQVFVDYRMGQRHTVNWGEYNKLVFMGFDLNVPYDVYLDTVDDQDGECTHYLFLRKDLFSKDAAERLARSYKCLIEAFAAQPGMTASDVDLSDPVDLEGMR